MAGSGQIMKRYWEEKKAGRFTGTMKEFFTAEKGKVANDKKAD